MRTRSKRARRRKSQTSSSTVRLVNTLIILFILFIPFQKESIYFLKFIYYLILNGWPIPVNLLDINLAGSYFWHMVLGLVVYLLAWPVFGSFFVQFILPVPRKDEAKKEKPKPKKSKKGKPTIKQPPQQDAEKNVLRLSERRQIYQHFRQFSRGKSGPLIFVRDGQEISHYGEREKEGPGVVMVNSNSAIVLGNKVFGPGMRFTEGKKIKTIFDLRRQIRTQEKVTAITRDGIEIETDIFVQFSISGIPHTIYVTEINNQIKTIEFDETTHKVTGFSNRFPSEERETNFKKVIQDLMKGEDPDRRLLDPYNYPEKGYRFNLQRVQTVYDNQPWDPETGKQIDWRNLPLAVAIEEFRNTIVRYPFDELFIKQDPQSQQMAGAGGEFPLSRIRIDFARRMRESGMVSFYFVQGKDRQPVRIGDDILDPIKFVKVKFSKGEKDYLLAKILSQQPLARSAITVSGAWFGEVIPTDEEVQVQTIQNLIARWKSEAFKTEVSFEEQASLIRSRAKTQVQQDTVYALAEFLNSKDQMKTAIILRIFQALEAATAGTSNPEMVSMVNMLSTLRKWFS